MTLTATAIAADIAAGRATATATIDAALDRIAARNPAVNAFTDIVADRAREAAASLDARIAAGEPRGPLAGVPFAVKNLFDIAGLPTRAGSRINRDNVPAARDGALVRKLEAAGAILVGGLNMGEYAYDFTGENAHDGPSRNPHDTAHMTGGSSGGSGGAVAAGLVPIALGSDTNGSIRVPAAFCGTFGLKPTFGRLSRAGSYPFVASFDHLGPLARSVADLALASDAMQGRDTDDHWQADRPIEPVGPTIEAGSERLRIAVAGGYFARGGHPECFEAVRLAAEALGVTRTVDIPEAGRARAAAYVITAAEAAGLHLDRLKTRPGDYDPAVRDRLIAGATIPTAWTHRAQRFRAHFRERTLSLFDDVDVILAPTTSCRAPRIGQATMMLDGVEVLTRPNIGLFTQPISFIGLPVVSVPVWPDAGLPLGVQVIAAPWREDLALRVARALELAGVASAPIGTSNHA